MAGNSVTGRKAQNKGKRTRLCLSFIQTRNIPTSRSLAVRQQRRTNLSAPWKQPHSMRPFSLQLQRQLGLAAASPPRGFNEPHFHGGGDTSSFRRREATKKWSGLCQPQRPCYQLCQTSRISFLESARNSRMSYKMWGRCIIVRLIASENTH